jgi:uncharacterized protein involved in exopolysaccharide biosynthesis
MPESSSSRPIPKDDEIDLLEIARQLWAGRKIILIVTFVFCVLGGFYLLYKKLTLIPEYTSQVTLYVDCPTPETLPTLLTGNAFLAEMIKIRLTLPETSQTATVMEVLNDHTLPPQGSLAGLRARVRASSGKPCTMGINVMMQDPTLAQQLADSITQHLAPFLVTFQMQRTQNNLLFLNSRYRDAEAAYLTSLKTLSDFYSQNAQNLRAMDTIMVKRLRAESDVKLIVYGEVAKQIEEVKIKEMEQTPLYSVLEAATIASQTNSPKTVTVMLVMLFLGLIAGVGAVFGLRIFGNSKMNQHHRIS